MTSPKDLRDYLFRGLGFEAEATSFEKAGIQVGATNGAAEERLLTERLAPFEIRLRTNALEMASLYAVLHCFENALRGLVSETLAENVGPDWWEKVPKSIKARAESRLEKARKDSWLEGERQDLLAFADFGDLASIIENEPFWPYFQPLIPSVHWLKQKFYELEQARNYIAHNRVLLPAEFQRLYMHVSDWNRVIGL